MWRHITFSRTRNKFYIIVILSNHLILVIIWILIKQTIYNETTQLNKLHHITKNLFCNIYGVLQKTHLYYTKKKRATIPPQLSCDHNSRENRRKQALKEPRMSKSHQFHPLAVIRAFVMLLHSSKTFYRTCLYRTCSTLTFLAVLGILGPWTSFSFDCRIFSFFFSRIFLANCLISIISSSSVSDSLSYSPAASLSSSSFSNSSSFLDFEEVKWRSLTHDPQHYICTWSWAKEPHYLITTLSHT